MATQMHRQISKYLDPKPHLVQLTPQVPEEVADEMSELAEKLGLSLNKVMLVAFRMFIEKYQQKK